MKRTLSWLAAPAVLAAVLVALAGCATAGSAPAALSPADLAAVKDLDQKFCDAMSSRNLEAAMACFWDSPDLVVVVFGNVARGTQAVRGGISQMLQQNASVKLVINEASYVPSGPDVLTVGTATYDLTAADGSSQQIVERWTDLKRKIAGRWVYVLDHATMVPR